MNNFTKFVKKTQERKLKSLKKSLSEKEDKIISPLKESLAKLETEASSLKKSAKKRLDEYKDYAHKKQSHFSELRHKNEVVGEVYEETISKILKQNKYHTDWIKKGLSQLPTEAGEIRAGKSYDILKKLKVKNLKKDTTIEEGFIFVGERKDFEYLKGTYFSQIFTNNKKDLITLLFN